MTIFEINILGINISPSYYGLMYAIGFVAGYYILLKRKVLDKNKLDDLFLYIFLGVILGGRLGYILFYNLEFYLNNIFDILKVWEGGMSFHGGVIGVIIALFIFSKKYKIDFLNLSDHICLVLPIGLGLGRIGNYLNGELLGYSGYNGIFAVYKNGIGYFPSPLIEALLEGLILFIILNYLYSLNKNYTCNISGEKKCFLNKGQIAALFLILYGLFRIIVELLFREPDIQLGLIFGFISMGSLLSIPMIIIGLIIFYIKK